MPHTGPVFLDVISNSRSDDVTKSVRLCASGPEQLLGTSIGVVVGCHSGGRRATTLMNHFFSVTTLSNRIDQKIDLAKLHRSALKPRGISFSRP